MTRPSKRVREQAAMICAVIASTDDGSMSDVAMSAMESIGASWEAFHLARAAHESVTCGGARIVRVDDAEAEALLRTGWTP